MGSYEIFSSIQLLILKKVSSEGIPISISEMFKNFNVDKFDIIIEDGLHEYNANICFFENMLHFCEYSNLVSKLNH